MGTVGVIKWDTRSLDYSSNELVNIQLTRTAGLNESIFDDDTAPLYLLRQRK